ncbi:protein disulfide isomerase pTAC5, chloroplastic [Apium graveolens]|uniref:protein disulfide isomerase pTAC5, chloroplastic n=1 Tax=Apium graveolens TaxID=4045 RepID=UPI003D79125E
MVSSSFPLCLNPPFTNKPHTNSISPYTYKTSFQSLSKSYICFSISSNNSSFEREESRWLREEQRWLREEQRWIREESRWRNERKYLLDEIETLKSKIEELENVSDRNLNVGGVLQVLRNEVSRIAERGSSAVPLVVESLDEVDVEAESEVEEEVEVKEVIRVFEKEKGRDDEVKKKRIMLRKGSEGDDVRIMQEALQKLGFYCGEEDEEYSMFSSGTERAIKTWQASLRIPEDGIMSPELLEKLYGEQKNDVSGRTEKVDIKRPDVANVQKASNGAAASHTTEVPGIQKTEAKEKGVAESKLPPPSRVFLLGENRWEDSSRLIGRNKQDGGSFNTNTTRCISCRGEGRLLCSECDGTGEPNIEEQFMEWVDEGAKCPYCNGVGFEICDVCNGKVAS